MTSNDDMLEVNLDNIRQLIFSYVENYCDRRGIKPMEIPPRVWNGVLMKIRDDLIKPNKFLLRRELHCNEFDPVKVSYMCDIYITLCNDYDQLVSVHGFITMTNIERQSLMDWKDRASWKDYDIHKRLMDENEASLTASLQDRKRNPMSSLPVLNRYHCWNLPGVSREVTTNRALTSDQLPKLGGDGANIRQIAQSEND